MEEIQEIDLSRVSLDIIIRWILLNKEDTDAMDAVNRQTYPYTTKFKENAGRRGLPQS